MIEFGDPNALWLLWLAPLLVLFLRWRMRKRRQALERFADSPLVQRLVEGFLPHRRRWKLALLVTGVGLLSLALARPLYGQREEVIKRRGMDIVVAIDTSDSMLAEDLKPNRLLVAKREVNRLIDILDGDRIGLAPFAGDAVVQCPLTLDYAAAKMFLDDMDTNTVSRPGTALGKAIEVATRCFVQEEQKYKVLILITDGEDTVGSPDAREASKKAANQGVRIYTIGVGSREGVPIPIRNEKEELIGYKKDQQGGNVLSRLDEPLLRDVALATDGAYFRATTERFELDRIYDDINQLEEKELRAAVRLRGIDRFQYILLPALVLILAEPFLSERKSRERMKK